MHRTRVVVMSLHICSNNFNGSMTFRPRRGSLVTKLSVVSFVTDEDLHGQNILIELKLLPRVSSSTSL